MNMISTGSFLTEMDASSKQQDQVKKLTRAWEKKNSKAARGWCIFDGTVTGCLW
jgi:hypothetical protein